MSQSICASCFKLRPFDSLTLVSRVSFLAQRSKKRVVPQMQASLTSVLLLSGCRKIFICLVETQVG
jgi:hypothetical protein